MLVCGGKISKYEETIVVQDKVWRMISASYTI